MMLKTTLFPVMLVLVAGGFAEAGNILGLFFVPSKSHHILGSTLLKALAGKGHNVTMVSPFPLQKPVANYTDYELTEFQNFMVPEHIENLAKGGSPFDKILRLIRFYFEFHEVLLNTKEMRNLLASDSKFDAIILDYPLNDAFLGVSHRFKAPVIFFSPIGMTQWLNEVAGNLNIFSYVPTLGVQFSAEMNFKQRTENFLNGILSIAMRDFWILPTQKAFLKKHFPDAPTMEELYDNVALILSNSHYTTETPRPYTPNLIQIGGFHMQTPRPLSADLKKFLDEATEGVIYFSFGTNVKSTILSEEKLQTVLNCFSKLNLKILWKFEQVNKTDVSKNIRIETWLPQQSVLAHPNVKIFITHGGLGSVIESIYAGVPMIVMPFMADQHRNAADLRFRELGIKMNFDELTEEKLLNSIDALLNDPKYRNNIERVSSLYKDQPMNPLEKAIYWVEHVIKYKGANHLKPASLKLNIFQLLLLDVTLFLVAVLSLTVFAIYFVVRKLVGFAARKSLTKKVKSN